MHESKYTGSIRLSLHSCICQTRRLFGMWVRSNRVARRTRIHSKCAMSNGQQIKEEDQMNRRNFSSLAGASAASIALSACATRDDHAEVNKGSAKTYVLVHGAYHGAWCWKAVATSLRAAGHIVYTPTQTGLGERSHLIGFRPTLDTFIEDVTRVIEMEELQDVILVGHSFAGSTVSGVADRMPNRLRRLVYLDALILQSGQAPFDGLPIDVIERYRRQAQETSNGLSVPPPKPEYFGIVDAAQIAWVAKQLTPHPFPTYLSKLTLRNPVGNGLPTTYIACNSPFFGSTAKSREFVATMKTWDYREFPSGHDAMLIKPAELSRMLLTVG
jgi:pimeloyl-ACP methyl ester carboxylesterase